MKPYFLNPVIAAVSVLVAFPLCVQDISMAMCKHEAYEADSMKYIVSMSLAGDELAEKNLPETLSIDGRTTDECFMGVFYSEIDGLEFEVQGKKRKFVKEILPYDGEKYVLAIDAGRRRNVRCDIVISKDGYAPKSIEVSCTKRNPLAAYEVDYVDEMPKFLGGDKDSFAVWVSENMDYPEEALKQKHKGVIMVGFLVGKDGYLTDISLIRGLSSELDNETLKVVKSSPKWTPAMKDGEPVSMSFIMPVMFDIR